MDLAQILLFPVAVVSITLHEFAHAWMAKREGDDTAERLGRLTLNPISHMDLMGTVIVPLGMFYMTGLVFGWAKPVPVNPLHYRHPVASDIRVSLAGIVVNFLLALLAVVAVALLVRLRATSGFAGSGDVLISIQQALEFGILLNVVLAVFNLIPIPPLDGSHVVKYLLPAPLRDTFEGLGRYTFLLIILMVMYRPVGNIIFLPVRILMDYAYLLIDGLS